MFVTKNISNESNRPCTS